MGLWDDRAPEIESMRQRNATNAQIAAKYGVSVKTFKNQMALLRAKGLIGKADPVKPGPKPSSNAESIDYNSDGSYSSQKPLWMTLEQVKDTEYLLRAHGFEPDAWELVSAKNNIWNTNDKVHGIQTLYASKITVKPKAQGWTFDQLVEVVRANTQPVQIEHEPCHLTDKRMLELPIYDAHFGNATIDAYRDTQRMIHELLISKHWDEVLFVIGSDLFHADNFKSTTVSGTQLETVDMPRAWTDCDLFYGVLIETAFRQSNIVKLVYIPGNHDQSFGWTFVQYLKAKYPQAKVDDRVRERKVVTYGFNFIGLAHGDKARKDLIRIFPAEFPMEWAGTSNRTVHIGHLHREEEIRAKDEFGLTVRTLSTRNPIDQYHDDNGYVTAHRRFMLFEYDTETLRHIHYV